MAGFFLFLAVFLTLEFFQLLGDAAQADWVLVSMLGLTLLLFLVMGLSVLLLDFDQDLRLTRQGIYIIPAVFKSYLLPWDDIEKIQIREANGYKAIEYRLRPGSPTYAARLGKMKQTRLMSFESRTGGFHGAIPAQNYRLPLENNQAEQNLTKINKLFPLLYRYWANSAARSELPESFD